MPTFKRTADNPFDLSLDSLSEAWLEQPSLMFKHSEEMAKQRLVVDQAKSNLEVVQADLAQTIRTNPGRYGHEKVTEKIVEECVVGNKKYQQAVEALQTAKYELDILQAYVSALDHRKKALEKLVDLHGQGYFATPRASDNSRDEMNELEKRFSRTRGRKKTE